MPGWTRRAFVGALSSGALACATHGASLGGGAPSRFPADARLLIVNLDDLGILQAVDAAALALFEQGTLVSGSAMPACPWFPEIVDYARSHPSLDLGLHFAFTSEGAKYRWGPGWGHGRCPPSSIGRGTSPPLGNRTER